MTRFTIGAAEIATPRPSEFGEFVEIAKGRSIVSVGDWGDGRFELGLSGGLMLRLFSDGPAEVNLISTINPNEIPPLVVSLGDLPNRTPIHVIEDKLRGLRTLHAIFWLAQNGRLDDLMGYTGTDIERDLLDVDDQLHIESISYGSWLLALWAKTTSAYTAISSVAGLVYERGRDAYLRKLEANASLLENQANREAVEVAKLSFDTSKSQLDYLLDVADRIDAPEIKDKVKARILDAVDELTLGDSADSNARRRLEGPGNMGRTM
ncbi:MAG: hypothetical protein WD872_15870 [Pirellulaceae bacterium]